MVLEPETPVGEVMAGPPAACYPDDPLEDGLEMMQGCGMHQLFVMGASREHVIGVLAYADIVGLLYRYCHVCRKNTRPWTQAGGGHRVPVALTVGEVMTPDVQRLFVSEPESEMITGVLSLSDAARFQSGSCRACVASRLLV